MGSSLSIILSDLVMEKLLYSVIPKFPYQPPFFKKYVDDNITLIPKIHIDETLQKLNSYHSKIQFTKENQVNNKIPFLDLQLIIENNHIITDYYRKPTSSGRILNFYSAHPFHMKFNTILNFAKRIKRLSDRRFDTTNIDIITTTLEKNNYPPKIIRSILKKFHYFDPNNDKPKDKKINIQTRFAAIPFIKDFSEPLTGKLRIINDNLNFAYKPQNRLAQRIFTNTKAKLPKNEKAGVVYKIKCMGNSQEECDGVYIGETSKKLNERIKRHKSDINANKTNKKLAGCTALIKHINEKRHNFDTENIQIINNNQSNTYKRRFLESTQIQFHKPTPVNYKVDTENLNTTYCNIINKYKVIQNRKRTRKK